MTEILSEYLTVLKDDEDQVTGAIVMREGKGMNLAANDARGLIQEGRFFDKCQCRPIITQPPISFR